MARERSYQRRGMLEGMPVVAIGGQRVGVVGAVLLDESGWGPESGVFRLDRDSPPPGQPARLFLPFSVVRVVQDGTVYLDLTPDELEHQEWTRFVPRDPEQVEPPGP